MNIRTFVAKSHTSVAKLAVCYFDNEERAKDNSELFRKFICYGMVSNHWLPFPQEDEGWGGVFEKFPRFSPQGNHLLAPHGGAHNMKIRSSSGATVQKCIFYQKYIAWQLATCNSCNWLPFACNAAEVIGTSKQQTIAIFKIGPEWNLQACKPGNCAGIRTWPGD